LAWELEVGAIDSRNAIQDRHGGSRQRGISAPAADSGLDSIMLWWEPDKGEHFGYEDGWALDGQTFFFSGTGREGDQQFEHPTSENARVRDHVANGDHVRLLRYLGKNEVVYVGELQLSGWTWRDGYDRLGQVRRMIEFRFVPVGRAQVRDDDRVRQSEPALAEVPRLSPPLPPSPAELAAVRTTTFEYALEAARRMATRREALLLERFVRWLGDVHGLRSSGLTIPHGPSGAALQADLWVPARRLLVEAKSTVSREAVRLALGQLLDYQRYLNPRPLLAVLTPSEPPQDMVRLLADFGVGAAWEGTRRGDFRITQDLS
jgi:hypothetical protein